MNTPMNSCTKRVRISFCLYAICLTLFGTQQIEASDSSTQVGVGVHLGLGWHDFTASKAAVERLNVSVRDEVFWGDVEKVKGALVFPEKLKALDELVTSTVRQGRRPIIILNYGNALYGGGLPISPEARSAYARYARFVVNHFKGRVNQFEVWNEWNIGSGSSKGQVGTAGSYVELLKVAYRAIKDENPGAFVIGGAVAQVDEGWIQAFGQAGGFDYLDGFSVHPYEYWWVRTVGPGAPIIDFVTSYIKYSIERIYPSARAAMFKFVPDPGTPEASMARLDSLKSHVDSFNPNREIPIYITEIGWPTNAGRYGVTTEMAAAYLQRFMLLARVRPWIAGVWWYDLFDDGDDLSNKEHRFGLIDRGKSEKAAYHALLEIKEIMDSFVRPTFATDANGVITISLRSEKGVQYRIAWIPSDDFSRRIKWSEGSKLVGNGYRRLRQVKPDDVAQIGAFPAIFVDE